MKSGLRSQLNFSLAARLLNSVCIRIDSKCDRATDSETLIDTLIQLNFQGILLDLLAMPITNGSPEYINHGLQGAPTPESQI